MSGGRPQEMGRALRGVPLVLAPPLWGWAASRYLSRLPVGLLLGVALLPVGILLGVALLPVGILLGVALLPIGIFPAVLVAAGLL